MPIAPSSLAPGSRIRFVGPAGNKDPEFLVAPADGKEGPVCVVIRVVRGAVILHLEGVPEKHFHAECKGGLLFRFVGINELSEKLDRDWKQIEREMEIDGGELRERTKAFNERQMSGDEKAEAAKRVEVAKKMMEFKLKMSQKTEASK